MSYRRVLPCAVLLSSSVACGSHPTGPTVPYVPFTYCDLSQNRPDEPIAGCWVGTSTPTDVMSDCDSRTGASATFEQVGSTVHGTLLQNCGSTGLVFTGMFTDNVLSGDVKGTSAGRASGTVDGDQLEFHIPGSTMYLHR